MKKFITIAALMGAGVALAACETSDGGGYATQLPSTPPQYGNVVDISDFNGARAGQAEGGLNQRGYYLARTQGLTSFWWNEGTQTCARIVTANGRFSSVSLASRGECNR